MNSETNPQDVKWVTDDAALVLWSSFSQEAYVQLRNIMPAHETYFLSRNLMENMNAFAQESKLRLQEGMQTTFHHRELSSTYVSTILALQLCSEVNLYGVDGRGGKFHYYDDYDPSNQVRDSASFEYLLYLALESMGYVSSIEPQDVPNAQDIDVGTRETEEVSCDLLCWMCSVQCYRERRK